MTEGLREENAETVEGLLSTMEGRRSVLRDILELDIFMSACCLLLNCRGVV